MNQPNNENTFSIKPLQWIMLFAVLQIAVAMFTNTPGFSFDEAMWQYIGRNWFRNGLVPYSGGVDNKSPLIFAVFGLSDKLAGVNYWLPRVFGTVCQSVGIFYVYKIARHVAGERAGVIALSLYGLSLLWRSVGSKYVSYTETYAVTCIIVSFYIWLVGIKNRNFFISGFIGGIGAAFRLSAFFGIAAIFISAARRNFKSSVVFTSGVIAGFGIFILWMIACGISVHDFIFYAFTDNFGPGSPTDHSALWRIENFLDKFFYSELILFYPAVIGYFMIVKKIDAFGIWLICEFVGIHIIGIYDRVHMKNFLPVLSVMSAVSIQYFIDTYKISTKQVTLILWITFFPKLIEPFVGLKKLFKPPADKSENYCRDADEKPDEEAKRKLGLWIRANTKDTDKVYIGGMSAQAQVYTERVSPTIYFNSTETERAKERLKNDLISNRPTLVALPVFADYTQNTGAEMRNVTSGFVKKQYRQDTCLYGYAIYKLMNR